jgi:transposase-like protein
MADHFQCSECKKIFSKRQDVKEVETGERGYDSISKYLCKSCFSKHSDEDFEI